MMCPHCEARVTSALEALPGVASAIADHKKAIAKITLTAPISDEKLKAAIESAGYRLKK